MRKKYIIILISVLVLWISLPVLQLRAQSAAIEGIVTDANTDLTLEGANIFLSGTRLGTATDGAGFYRLPGIPPGKYRLVISFIGYESKQIDVTLGAGETKNMNVELKPVTYRMGELYVKNRGKKWERNLKRFIRHFIGTSQLADSVTILNPEVLRFDTNWLGRLQARARAPLKIENHALGYHIRYDLREFEHSGLRTRWDGDPFFTEMTPSDSAQAVFWNENRRKAYYGSLRHYLLSLLQGRSEVEGFITYQYGRDIYGSTTKNKSQINVQRFIEKSNTANTYEMNFFGRLEIVYPREEQGWRYLRWAHQPDAHPGGSQISFIKLNQHPVSINTNGEFVEPYGATLSGYFAFERLADLTPKGYRPEGY